jgi:hypothetical protein
MKAVGAGFKTYETVKRRQSGQVVNPNACKGITDTFVRRGKLDGPGGRSGPCGSEKDHERVYCC